MIACVVREELAADQPGPAIIIVEPTDAAMLRRSPGFQGAVMLSGPAGQAIIVLTLWDDEQHWHAFRADADQRDPFQRALASQDAEIFEVAQSVGHGGGRFTRFITAEVVPGSVDTVIGLFQNVVLRAATAQQGFHRGLLLVNRQLHRIISIGFWESTDARHSSQDNGYLRAQVAAFADVLVSQPVVHHLDVSGEIGSDR